MDDFQKLLLETFTEELRDTVQALEKALLELERAEQAEQRDAQYAILARRSHNLKGAAGAAGFSAIQSLAHAFEDGLLTLRKQGEMPTPIAFDVMYAAVDAFTSLAQRVDALPEQELEERLRQVGGTGQAPNRQEVGGTGQAPNRQEVGETGQAPNRQEVGETGQAPNRQELVALKPAGRGSASKSAQAERSVQEQAPLPASQSPDPESAAPASARAVPADATPAPAIQAATAVVPSPVPEPPVPSPAAPVAAASATQADALRSDETAPQTTRVAIAKLNALTNQISEIIAVSKKAQARLSEIGELQEHVSAAIREFQLLRHFVDRVLGSSGARSHAIAEAMDKFSQQLDAFETRFAHFQRQAMQEAIVEGLLTEQLPEDIKRLRMRPFSSIEEGLRRTVREAARLCEKQLELDFQGMQYEADQVVLEVLRDPLMHLLRNCVDHGIESPAERLQSGKPVKGTVRVEVVGHGTTMGIIVSDDGRGIDTSLLRNRLAARKLIPEAQLSALSERELIDLIFLPGFSTAQNTGMISGRGIGMDVVRQVMQMHHGSIAVRTELGRGTSFELTIPQTFATMQGILLRVLGHDFALPMHAIDRLIRFSRRELRYQEGSASVLVDDHPIALVSLSEVLEVPPRFNELEDDDWDEDRIGGAQSSMLCAAVVHANDERVAFMVDDFVEDAEIVVKELPSNLGHVRCVAGATVTWSGEVMVILNPTELIDVSLRRGSDRLTSEWAADQVALRRILVCDDSLTTRTLERNILMAAGYEVVTANNGLQALDALEQNTFQLLVLDVDMPDLDGFELTTRLRANNLYRSIPIILVTSRDTDEDKRRGMAAGADAYITKGSFTQRTFLETVRRFLT
ncbi:MAG: response regulator [Myxococcota bacterium]|jgi:chemotaxis protein histidine kinase CheA|nr:response regulator [Myxococcota bacterium]